tara:strand:- start:650 stop:1270 length:621 start_codon:yes stop_codon:yes gene_type:complete
MNCIQSIELINSFSLFPLALSTKSNKAKFEALEQQRRLTLPQELKAYIEQVCPSNNTSIKGVGHPIDLLSIEQLSWQMEGYNFDSVNQTTIKGWQDNWFLIASEGGEPVIIDLDDNLNNDVELSPVYSAMQTSKGWDFAKVADSIGQYLLSAKAIEHAMNFPNVDEPIDDDFNLALPAADWLFPYLKIHATNHYDEWASVFENYLD